MHEQQKAFTCARQHSASRNQRKHSQLLNLICVCPQDGSGKSKCFGFINFSEPEAAAKAVEELTGREVNGKSLYAGR